MKKFYVWNGFGKEEAEIKIGTTLVNVATPNDYVEGGCNPGFTTDGGETPVDPEPDPEPEPEPEPEPDPEPGTSADIELQIPDRHRKRMVCGSRRLCHPRQWQI